MVLEYNVPQEVTKEQLATLQKKLGGCFAHREHEGKIYIKPWLHIEYMEKLLNS